MGRSLTQQYPDTLLSPAKILREIGAYRTNRTSPPYDGVSSTTRLREGDSVDGGTVGAFFVGRLRHMVEVWTTEPRCEISSRPGAPA